MTTEGYCTLKRSRFGVVRGRNISFALLACALSVVTLACLTPLDPLHAATLRAGSEYSLESSTKIDGDLYVAGKRIDIAGAVSGDAVVLGTDVSVTGDIDADLMVAGGTVELAGSVAGDVRVVGGMVTVRGVVEEDLVVSAGSVHVEEGAQVLGSMFVYADRLVFDGVVRGSMEVRARSFEMKGGAEHDVLAKVSDSISVVDDARIVGQFTYHAPREVFLSQTATITGPIHPNVFDRSISVTDSRVYVGIVQVLMFVLSALALVRLFPMLPEHLAVYTVRYGSGKRILIGFVFLFALPVIAILGIITIMLAPLGLLLLLVYVSMALVSVALAPVAVASMLRVWLKRGDAGSAPLIFLGAIVFVLLSFVPLIGPLVRFMLVLFVFGSLLMIMFDLWRRLRSRTDDPARATSNMQHDMIDTIQDAQKE